MCMGNEHETPECSRNEPRDIDATSDLDQRANDVDAVCSRESSRTLNRTCLMCGGAPLHRDFGQRSVALAATGLLSDWPRPLRPTDDPHVLAIAQRTGRSSAQVLIRWALQLGLAVVFHADRVQHVRENLGALGFELPRREMQLISGLVTLADPVPPGDGFGHPYAPRPVPVVSEL